MLDVGVGSPVGQLSLHSAREQCALDPPRAHLRLHRGVDSVLLPSVSGTGFDRGRDAEISCAYRLKTRGTPAMKCGLIIWASSKRRRVSPVVSPIVPSP
jgi:hypothetical protein